LGGILEENVKALQLIQFAFSVQLAFQSVSSFSNDVVGAGLEYYPDKDIEHFQHLL
jgi:hypothetical protein